MANEPVGRSTASRIYVWFVISLGFAVTALSAYRLFQFPPRPDFYSLAALTLISGLLPLKLPNVSANISVSETFVFAGTLLLGASSGTVLVFLDALLIWVRLARQNGAAVIAIGDQGIGIPEGDLSRLGTAFTRGAGKASTFAGMGIGLHVAKLVAEAHGGSLELASPGEDKGTTVTVRLPL